VILQSGRTLFLRSPRPIRRSLVASIELLQLRAPTFSAPNCTGKLVCHDSSSMIGLALLTSHFPLDAARRGKFGIIQILDYLASNRRFQNSPAALLQPQSASEELEAELHSCCSCYSCYSCYSFPMAAHCFHWVSIAHVRLFCIGRCTALRKTVHNSHWKIPIAKSAACSVPCAARPPKHCLFLPPETQCLVPPHTVSSARHACQVRAV